MPFIHLGLNMHIITGTFSCMILTLLKYEALFLILLSFPFLTITWKLRLLLCCLTIKDRAQVLEFGKNTSLFSSNSKKREQITSDGTPHNCYLMFPGSSNGGLTEEVRVKIHSSPEKAQSHHKAESLKEERLDVQSSSYSGLKVGAAWDDGDVGDALPNLTGIFPHLECIHQVPVWTPQSFPVVQQTWPRWGRRGREILKT